MNKTMNQYQLDMLRKRFADRGYEPLNTYRSHYVIGWMAVGICLGAILAFVTIF